MVNGLNDPSTTSYSGVRWISPNGTLMRMSNGTWGLFFSGGNCLDGDSTWSWELIARHHRYRSYRGLSNRCRQISPGVPRRGT